jgi:TP901 family phage tail tape measure protein
LAEQHINTNITATANFSSLTAQLQAITAELIKLQTTTIGLNKNLSNQIGIMNRSFAETLRSTGQFSTHFVTLTSDVDKFGKNLDSGRMKLSQYFNTWQGHARKTNSLVKDLAKQQVLMENAILQPLGKNAQGLMQYNVHVAQGLDTIKNKTALARQEAAILNKVMQDGANQLINWGKNTQWAGRQLTVGLTVPMAAFGAAASKAFREADAELVRLTKVYGGLGATTQEQLAQVREDVKNTAKELASAYGVSYRDTIALAADIAATGKEGKDLISSTAETTRLAVLGEVDRQEAMKATLAIQTAFKQNTEGLTQSIDFLNAVENQTSTSLADLVEAIPKAGPVVKSLGGDIKDLALYLTAMKEGGVNAAEGANAIKSAMASLINPTKVAIGMFNDMGIDLSGIVNKNAGNLTQTILDLQAALDTLDPLSKSRAIEQLFGKFQYARMSALFENLGKEGSQTLQVIDLMKASTTDLANISARELSAMTESASGKYRRALETVKADLAAVGESFLKINTFVLQTIDGIVKFVDKLPGPVKNLLTLMGGLTALAGPLIMLTGVLGNFFGYVIKGVFHLKNLFRGGDGFKLLTPEIMAASKAGSLLEQSFYNDAKATATLKTAVESLAQSFDVLKDKALSSSVAVSQTFNTMAGNPLVQSPAERAVIGERIADKNHPLIGQPYSRQMSHMIPAQSQQPGTIFGTVPGPGPVNVRIGKNPQMYMQGELPHVAGLTSIRGVSTGVVADEAAKWHAMTAAIATQSQQEIALLKTEVAATGTITASLSDAYQAMLPKMQELTALAAQESSLIVKELQAGKMTVDQARVKIMELNAVVEAMMAETATQIATGMGRTINLTTVPLTTQPVVGPGGKSNMKELFHKSDTSKLVDEIARNLGVRTSGGGFSIETTVPKNMRRYNSGGSVETFGPGKTKVSGPTSINYDDRMGQVPLGGYVLNQAASMDPANKDLVDQAKYTFNSGGKVDAMLTPGETVFGPKIQQNPALFAAVDAANYGYSGGGKVIYNKFGYGNPAPKVENKAYWRDQLKQYMDFINNPQYEDDIRMRMIMLDAAELADHMDPKEALRTATANWDQANKGARGNLESFVRIRQRQTDMLEEKLGGEQKLRLDVKAGKQSVARSTALNRNLNKIRSLMLKSPDFANVKDAVESIPKTGGVNSAGVPYLNGSVRGHVRRRGTIEGKGSRGFFGVAAVIPNNLNSLMNRLDQKGLMPDIVHLTRENAIASLNGMIEKAGMKGMVTVDDIATALAHDTKFKSAAQLAKSKPTLASKEQRNALNMLLEAITQNKKWKIMPPGRRLVLANKGGYMNFGGGGPLTKSILMKNIGAGFGPTGEKASSSFQSAPWGVKSLSLGMGRKLFGSSGLTPRGQNLMYNYLAEALNQEMPYGYMKNDKGQLLRAVEPETLDLMIRQAARSTLASGDKRLSQIDRKILREKYTSWDAKGWTPSTKKVRQQMFGFNNGGPVGYGMGGVIGKMLMSGVLSSVGFPLGSSLGSKVGGDMGGMMGGMLLSTLLGGIPFAGASMPTMKRSGNLEGPRMENGSFFSNQSAITKPLPGMEKMSTKLASLGANGGKFAGVLGRMGGLLSKLPMLINPAGLAIAGVTAALAIGIKRWGDHNEHLRIGMTQYSLTADAAQKAGLKFKDYNAAMKSVVESAQALREKNQLIYESLMSANQPIEMTIEEYKKLKKEVKDVFADQIKLINQTKGDKNLKNVAVDLKNQFIAAGMSSEEATKKIYAMFKVSKQSASALLATVSSPEFTKIVDASSAAVSSVSNYSRSARQGGREGAGAVQTSMTAMDTAVQDIISKSRKAAAKDKTGNTKVLTELQAEQQLTEKINKAKGSGAKITQETINELAKQNPLIRKFASTQDTVLSLWQKVRLQAKGYSGDLSELNAKQTAALLAMANSVSSSVETKNKEGLLKSNYDYLEKLTAQQKKLIAAQKGASVQQQINTRDQLRSLQKQIDLNNKLAESRLKALDLAKQEGDLARELEKKRAAYEAAVATGNTAEAQQLSLDMQGIQKEMQYNSQRSAIENARDAANKPLQAKIDAINAAQEKMGDAAALAGEGLAKLNDKIAKEKQKIDEVNNAMTALAVNAAAAGMTLEEYVKSSKEAQKQATRVEAAARGAGIKTTAGQGATSSTVTYTPGSGVTVVPGSKGKTAVQSGLDLMTDPKNGIAASIAAGLEKNGIQMGSGDIYINGKKVDMPQSGGVKSIGSSVVSTTVGFGTSKTTTSSVSPMSLNNAGIPLTVGTKFKDKSGKEWKISGNASSSTGWNVPVVKAGYGLQKIDPNKLTIVGDRGMEAIYQNMVIPNISSVPYASPRFDIKNSNLMATGQSGQQYGNMVYEQHIHATDGMNEAQLISMAKAAAIDVFQNASKSNKMMIGESKNIRVKRS